MKVDITYLGYSEAMMDLLMRHNNFCLKKIITKAGVLSKEKKSAIVQAGIAVVEDDSAKDLDEKIDTKICLIYKYGRIIPKSIIEKKDFYNIHPGSIRTNRGAHPLRWSVLLGDEYTYLSLYGIDGIDEGDLICEEPVKIENLNYIEADDEMDRHLNNVLDSFVSYLEKGAECEKVVNGIYRNKVSEEDYRIELKNDSFDTSQRKIRAVVDFGGAVVVWGNEKYRAVRAIEGDKFLEASSSETPGQHIYLIGDKNGRYFIECSEYKWI